MSDTLPGDPNGKNTSSPAPIPGLPEARTADGGGVFRALTSIVGAVFFLFIAMCFVGYALYLSVGKSDSTEQSEKAAGQTVEKSDAGEEKDTVAPPELELVSALPFPDVIGNVYVFCMVKYTGTKPANFVRVDATLTDADGGEVATGFGYSLLNTVEPGQTVPVSVLVKKPGEHAKIKTKLSFRTAPDSVELLKIDVTDAKMTTTPSLYIEGRLMNNTAKSAGTPHAVGVVYDASGAACGAGSGYTTSKVLAPGTGEPFKAYIHPQKCKPARFEVLTEATAK